MKSKIKMHLNEGPFRAIEAGEKTVEYRVNDEKRQQIAVGDVIEFVLRDADGADTDERFEKTIVGLHTFPTFEDMFAAFPPHNGNLDMAQYYPEEEVQKYGVVAIELE